MALSPEHEAQILRYYHAERWRIGTIAVQLGLHRDTVARAVRAANRGETKEALGIVQPVVAYCDGLQRPGSPPAFCTAS